MTGVPAPTLRQKLWGWLRDYLFVARWMLWRSSDAAALTSCCILSAVRGHRCCSFPVSSRAGGFSSQWPSTCTDRGIRCTFWTGSATTPAPSPTWRPSSRTTSSGPPCDEVTIVAHSKGGLIAKHALRDPATLARVRHVIAVNTPFSGSSYASWFLLPSVRMFAPNGPVIRALSVELAVNHRISSLYSVFDPHIPESSCLEGAENIVLATIGHFRPLGVPNTLRMITAILEILVGCR